jgi:hypothetical protein
MTDQQKPSADFHVDRSNLYREEAFTDMKIGSVRRLTPVKPDGSEDKTRKTIFIGQTNIMTPQGPVPIQGLIQAKDLQQAVKKFPEAMEAAMERLIEQAQRHQQQEQARVQKPDSRIIIPGR